MAEGVEAESNAANVESINVQTALTTVNDLLARLKGCKTFQDQLKFVASTGCISEGNGKPQIFNEPGHGAAFNVFNETSDLYKALVPIFDFAHSTGIVGGNVGWEVAGEAVGQGDGGRESDWLKTMSKDNHHLVNFSLKKCGKVGKALIDGRKLIRNEEIHVIIENGGAHGYVGTTNSMHRHKDKRTKLTAGGEAISLLTLLGDLVMSAGPAKKDEIFLRPVYSTFTMNSQARTNVPHAVVSAKKNNAGVDDAEDETVGGISIVTRFQSKSMTQEKIDHLTAVLTFVDTLSILKLVGSQMINLKSFTGLFKHPSPELTLYMDSTRFTSRRQHAVLEYDEYKHLIETREENPLAMLRRVKVFMKDDSGNIFWFEMNNEISARTDKAWLFTSVSTGERALLRAYTDPKDGRHIGLLISRNDNQVVAKNQDFVSLVVEHLPDLAINDIPHSVYLPDVQVSSNTTLVQLFSKVQQSKPAKFLFKVLSSNAFMVEEVEQAKLHEPCPELATVVPGAQWEKDDVKKATEQMKKKETKKRYIIFVPSGKGKQSDDERQSGDEQQSDEKKEKKHSVHLCLHSWYTPEAGTRWRFLKFNWTAWADALLKDGFFDKYGQLVTYAQFIKDRPAAPHLAADFWKASLEFPRGKKVKLSKVIRKMLKHGCTFYENDIPAEYVCDDDADDEENEVGTVVQAEATVEAADEAADDDVIFIDDTAAASTAAAADDDDVVFVRDTASADDYDSKKRKRSKHDH